MLYGRNKVITLDCSIKHFLIPNSAMAMTLITHLYHDFKTKSICLSYQKQVGLSVILANIEPTSAATPGYHSLS